MDNPVSVDNVQVRGSHFLILGFSIAFLWVIIVRVVFGLCPQFEYLDKCCTVHFIIGFCRPIFVVKEECPDQHYFRTFFVLVVYFLS